MGFSKFVLLSIVLSLGAEIAWAQPSSNFTRVVNLPVVGLASSETVQVNVVNLAASVQAVSVPNQGATATCTGGITFYDAKGNSISSTTFTIGTGQIFSSSLSYSETLPPTAGPRTAIWSTVTLSGTKSVTSPCLLASNVETFDTATGVTHVHAEGVTLGFPELLDFAGRAQSSSR